MPVVQKKYYNATASVSSAKKPEETRLVAQLFPVFGVKDAVIYAEVYIGYRQPISSFEQIR